MSKKQAKEVKVVIMRPTFCKGDPLEVGKTVSVGVDDGKALVTSGKAVYEADITAEDKTAIQEEEARLKAHEEKKAKASPDELAVTGKAAVQNAKKAGEKKPEDNGNGGDDPKEAAIKKLVDDHKAKELHAILDDLGVKYETDANKAALAALIVEHKKD